MESFAYVALWITARYNNGTVIQPSPQRPSPPFDEWIDAAPSLLDAVREYELFRCRHLSLSHMQFKDVYKAFFREVHGHIYTEAEAPEPPGVVFTKFTHSIDGPLEKLGHGHLTEVNRSQQRIREKSPIELYRLLARWRWVKWTNPTPVSAP